MKRYMKKKDIEGLENVLFVFFGKQPEKEVSSPELVTKELKERICSNKKPLSVLAKETAKKFGLSRKQVYGEALRIKNEQS